MALWEECYSDWKHPRGLQLLAEEQETVRPSPSPSEANSDPGTRLRVRVLD